MTATAATGENGVNPKHDFKREMLEQLPSLRAFALSLCRKSDQADDLVQDTVLSAWSKQSSYTPGTSIRAWMFTILRNGFYSQMRKAGREIGDPDSILTNNMAVHASQLGAMDMADFKKALNILPPDQREAVLLVGALGFSYEEAAEICECAIGTMKSRVSRARTRLQELLGVSSHHDFGPDSNSASVVHRL